MVASDNGIYPVALIVPPAAFVTEPPLLRNIPPAPEIDPESAAAALTLLAGGLAVLRARRAGKSEKKDS